MKYRIALAVSLFALSAGSYATTLCQEKEQNILKEISYAEKHQNQNAGVRETERKSIGLIHQDNSTDAMEEIKKIFTPEFRNRLDNIIWFDHLSTDVIHQVVDKFIVELQVQLDQKGVSLEVSQEARNWLAEKGYDRAMGAILPVPVFLS